MARGHRAYLATLIALSVALWLPRLRGPLDLRYDAGVYYVLGTSLAEGRGYRLLSEPGSIQEVQYPPLLPAVVAVHQRLAGTSDPVIVGHWLRITYAVVFVAYIAAVYVLASRFLPAWFAFITGLITLLQVHTTWMSDLLFTEIPFALTTVLFLLAASSRGRARAGLSGVLAAAGYLLRSIGVAALAAWVAESFLRRNPRQLIARGVVSLIPLLGWQLYIRQVQASPEYAHPAYAYQRAPYQYYNVSYLENLRYVDPFAPELGTVSAGAMAARMGAALVKMPASLGEAVSSRAEWSESEIRRLNAQEHPIPDPGLDRTGPSGIAGRALVDWPGAASPERRVADPLVRPRLNRLDGSDAVAGAVREVPGPTHAHSRPDATPESADPEDTALHDQPALGGSARETDSGNGAGGSHRPGDIRNPQGVHQTTPRRRVPGSPGPAP